MKTKNAIIILVAVCICFACNNLKHVKFTSDYTGNIKVPAHSELNKSDTVVTDIATNIEATAKKNNTSTDLIQSCKADALSLKITAPAGQSFSFVKDVRVFISTETQPEVEIASKHNILESGADLNCDIDDVELKQYIISDKIRLKVISINGEGIQTGINVEVHLRFKFEANLLAAL